MGRKFYGFGSPATVEKHVAQIKTIDDVWQLRHDIVASTTNRARFTGIERMWAIDYAPEGSGEFCRHIFIARTWVDDPENPFDMPSVPDDCKAYTIVD